MMRFASPVGELTITASETAITGVFFPTSRHVPPLRIAERGTGGEAENAVLAVARHQLEQYFDHTRTFFDLPLEPQGSDFEKRVWELLRTIPSGATTTYGDLARRLGDPQLARAVGAANGKNPIPIIVPCHRVLGAGGTLTGFGGGLDRKRWLLEHEGAVLTLGRV
ncbi:MAG: methylated-DNA--[protein]-cysteine S-methyltransferase [Gemmatimonadales bacterium]